MTEEMNVVVEAPAKKTRKTTKKAAEVAKVTITLKKSLNGRLQNQKDCAAALGLKKVGDVKVHPENAATMGKVAKISHLVEITK